MVDALEEILMDADDKMSKTITFLHEQFSGLRTGKASPSLVQNVKVQYYGTPTRLREIANISTPETRLIVISAYDPTALPEIEKAILAANLGVTPMNDGRVIRVPIPELSQERRAEMIKVGRRMAEDARVAVRNVRREANDQIKKTQKDGTCSEDERDEALEKTQKETDKFIAKIDEAMKAKEEEVTTV